MSFLVIIFLSIVLTNVTSSSITQKENVLRAERLNCTEYTNLVPSWMQST